MINRQSIIDTVIDNIKSGNYARAYMGETKENVPTARFALDKGFSANVTKGKGLLITIQVYEQDLQGIDFEQRDGCSAGVVAAVVPFPFPW